VNDAPAFRSKTGTEEVERALLVEGKAIVSDTDAGQLVVRLFDAWSSGDPERVAALFQPDATFFDSVNGQFEGREAIKRFYAGSLEVWDDLETRPTRIWADGDTAACVWTMTGQMKDDRFGEGLAGSRARIDGMAWVRFVDGLVAHDEEYFDRAAALSSLEGRGYVVPTSVHGDPV
jgi:uncharacterized protein (TIGR02246 family)